MNALQLAEAHADMLGIDGELARAFLRAHAALEECNKYNHINNDLQAYLFDKCEWGMGKIDHDVKPEDFGLAAG